MKKLRELKKELEEKRACKHKQRIKKEFIKEQRKENDNLKIIGITGSTGKSTVAYIVHEYLKKLGYKSCLYSSCKVDSPATFISPDNGVEISFKSEDDLLDIIEACEAYEADFLVLEVNERNIKKGITKDIPFTVKVLTNLIPEHNLSLYSKDEYVSIKKSFFEDDDCKHVIGYQGYDKDIFNDLLNLNKDNTYNFSSEYISKVCNINPNSFNMLLNKLETNIDGMSFSVKMNDNVLSFNSNLIFGYNALNLVCCIAIINALDKSLFNKEAFNSLINDLKIPGRSEVYKKGENLIVIDTHMTKALECLKDFRKRGLLDNIKVVVGSIGHGFVNWSDDFKNEKYIKRRHKIREKAMKKLDDVDYVYLTESDSGKEDALSICKELSSYLNEKVPREIITNREEAINVAIKGLGKRDALLITGRGNRALLCDGENHIRLLKDSDVLRKALKVLNKVKGE